MKYNLLKKGDKIALVAPASPIEGDVFGKIKRIENYINSLGFTLCVFDSCYAKYGYLAGRDPLRANDINRAFSREDIAAVLCLRGGYGSPRILDRLDYDMICKNPKPFMGFSDITALHAALYTKCEMATFHSPMPNVLLDNCDEVSLECMLNAIVRGEPVKSRCCTLKGKWRACGILTGGNLTMLCSLLGTGYFPDVSGKILFLEEVDECPYRLDRLFNQLRLAGVFGMVSGVVLGGFPKENKPPISFEEMVRELVRTDIIMCNLPCGHTTPNITLPLGAQVTLDADAGLFEQTYPLFI